MKIEIIQENSVRENFQVNRNRQKTNLSERRRTITEKVIYKDKCKETVIISYVSFNCYSQQELYNPNEESYSFVNRKLRKFL